MVVTSVIASTLATSAAATLAALIVCATVAMSAVLSVADAFASMPGFNLALLVLVAAEACVDPQVSAYVAGRAGRIVGRREEIGRASCRERVSSPV